MAAHVYRADLSANRKRNVITKLGQLFDLLEPDKRFAPRDLVAVKLHFGEAGNTASIRPQLVRKVIDRLDSLKIGRAHV